LLFTPSEDADANLAREGVAGDVHRVGNVMIDSLIRLLPAAERYKTNGLPERYALVTLHRPANVDDREVLKGILETLAEVGDRLHVVFPVHPRTQQRIREFGMQTKGLHLMDPKPYVEFLALQRHATVVITDSGGIQEETTYLGVPCLTMRDSTERPITVKLGTNVIVGRDGVSLRRELDRILAGERTPHQVPPLWDGHAAERIVGVLQQL
jgi:UDP-N-acetylglucosamine 2-epimerase (non-hydrolysing)